MLHVSHAITSELATTEALLNFQVMAKPQYILEESSGDKGFPRLNVKVALKSFWTESYG